MIASRRRGVASYVNHGNPGQLLSQRQPEEAPAQMLSCAKIRELQSEARGGSVTPFQRLALWLHVRICPPCAHADKALSKTLDLLRELGARETKRSK